MNRLAASIANIAIVTALAAHQPGCGMTLDPDPAYSKALLDFLEKDEQLEIGEIRCSADFDWSEAKNQKVDTSKFPASGNAVDFISSRSAIRFLFGHPGWDLVSVIASFASAAASSAAELFSIFGAPLNPLRGDLQALGLDDVQVNRAITYLKLKNVKCEGWVRGVVPERLLSEDKWYNYNRSAAPAYCPNSDYGCPDTPVGTFAGSSDGEGGGDQAN